MTAAPGFRSGFVALAGRPNSGKSTLLNRLVGEKISIVSGKPQTTRNVIRGILSRPEGQVVFLDTPGIHKPMYRMNALMMKAVRESLAEADAVALVVDTTVPFGSGDRFALDFLKSLEVPLLLLLNKVDRMQKPDLLPVIDRYSKLAAFTEILPISALKGDNVEAFVKALLKLLPEGPAYYPEDHLSDRQHRQLAADIVREKVIDATRDELPYATAVTVDQFEESETLDRIHATIHVERETQKGIVIGKGGSLLKEIGVAARVDLEKMLGKQVYLELRVEVAAGWRDDEHRLKDFGLAE